MNCVGRTILLDGRESVPISVLETSPLSSATFSLSRFFYSTPQPVLRIDLMLRPGHYDLLYPIGLIPPPQRELSIVAINRERDQRRAEKFLGSRMKFELYKNIVAAGVIAPYEVIIELTEKCPNLNSALVMYLRSSHAKVQITNDK